MFPRKARFLPTACLSAGFFVLLLFLLTSASVRRNGGVFVYPLDDAYIHLAIARNLSGAGVWGVTPHGFSGASSSPGWTLLLATLSKVAGVHLLMPLLLNALFAVCILCVCAYLVAREIPRASGLFLVIGMLVIIVVTPLPGLAFIGMEHTLHALSVLVFAACGARMLTSSREQRLPAGLVAIWLMAAFTAAAARYESVFVVGVVMLLLLLRQRVLLAALGGIAAALPPLLYGLYSYRHSGVYLPFSVIMKSTESGEHSTMGALLAGDMTPLVLLLAILFAGRLAYRRFWSYSQLLLFIALGTAVLHALIGPVGWLLRYEAYTYLLGALAAVIAIGEELTSPPQQAPRLTLRWGGAALAVAVLPFLFGLTQRAHHGFTFVMDSAHDRYVEHLPQALLVERSFDHDSVLANDIGFLAYYAPHVQILDPLGLGSFEPVALEREHRRLTPDLTSEWADRNHAQLAILHSDFPGMRSMIPTGWILVESWCFPHNLVFQNHVESFYAPNATAAAQLSTALGQLRDLPPELVRYHFGAAGGTPPSPARGISAACPAPAAFVAYNAGRVADGS